MLKHTPTTTTNAVSTKSDWASWDDYGVEAWERDWEKEYKYNEVTRTYDKRVDVDLEDDEDDLLYSPNAWDLKHEEAFSDICESCLETQTCKYDYNYDAPVCKDCAKSLYEDVPF
jgi:hypothetical protein